MVTMHQSETKDYLDLDYTAGAGTEHDYISPKMIEDFENQYSSVDEIKDFFTKWLWPIACSLLVGYNAIIAIWYLYRIIFYDYNWEQHYFVGFGLVMAIFVVSYSHAYFIKRD